MSKVWLITGCSRGLGRALAEAVLTGGDRLVATARSKSDLASLPHGENLRTMPLDVTDAAEARVAVEEAVSAFGRLDVVVANAGYIRANAIEHQPEEELRRLFEVNFFGAYRLAHAALPVLHAQRSGHIILVSSIGARRQTPGLGAYQAAKSAVGAFSEALAKEVLPLGIRVTCIEPGGMRTDMFGLSMLAETLSPDYEPTIAGALRPIFGDPARATSDPRKVAAAILRLSREGKPPVRLLLGSDAVRIAAEALAQRTREDEQWRELSTSTDFG